MVFIRPMPENDFAASLCLDDGYIWIAEQEAQRICQGACVAVPRSDASAKSWKHSAQLLGAYDKKVSPQVPPLAHITIHCTQSRAGDINAVATVHPPRRACNYLQRCNTSRARHFQLLTSIYP